MQKVKSTQKHIRMSPRKLRLVADMVRTMSPAEAMLKLPYVHKRAAKPLEKVIKSAVANAKEKGLTVQNLKFEEIQIGEGPRLKRFRAVSKGRAHSITKRMSHIRVVVTEVEKKSEPKKVDKNKK